MKCNHCQAEWNAPNSKMTSCPFCGKSLIAEIENKENLSTEQLLELTFKKFGSEVFKDNKRLSGILSDNMQHDKATLRLLKYAIENNIPSQLLDLLNNNSNRDIKLLSIKQSFKEAFFMEEERAFYAVNCFAHAFGLLVKEAPISKVGKGTNVKVENITSTVDPTPPTPRNQNKLFTVNGVSFEMVAVSGGTFTMGCTPEQTDCRDCEKPAHKVQVSDFYIGKHQVTQALWQAVMGTSPSHFEGAQLPVENVSWFHCQKFIKKLNQLTGALFRLPTEAEWEYAARGGNRSRGTQYAGSANADEVAWFDKNSGRTTHKVGLKRANELGIHDMSGNVWEWCFDWYCYDYYAQSPNSNPQGLQEPQEENSDSFRVLRGGSWFYSPAYSAAVLRVAFRYGGPPDNWNYTIGFRLALVQ